MYSTFSHDTRKIVVLSALEPLSPSTLLSVQERILGLRLERKVKEGTPHTHWVGLHLFHKRRIKDLSQLSENMLVSLYSHETQGCETQVKNASQKPAKQVKEMNVQ